MSDESDECPGEGSCHGSMCWCDRCGDVSATCEFPSCDRHHCASCRQLLTVTEQDEAYDRNDALAPYCSACWRAVEKEWLVQEVERRMRIDQITARLP